MVDPYLFSTHERTLLAALSEEGSRPRDLMRLTGIPHASLYLAFQKLVTRGFASRKVVGRVLLWFRSDVTVDESPRDVRVSTRAAAVRAAVMRITKLKAGERVTIVEGTQHESGWFSLFSKEETIALNSALSKRKVICDSIIPETYFARAVPKLGEDWALSYRTRPIQTYVVPHDLIASDALLLIFRDRIMLLYARAPLVIEVRTAEVVALIRGMADALKKTARKVYIGPDHAFHD